MSRPKDHPGPRRTHVAALTLALVSAGVLWFRDSASVVHLAAVLLHALAGIVLAGAWIASAWRRVRSDATVVRALEALLLASAAVSGLLIVVLGAVGPLRWLVPVHVSAAVAGTAAILLEARARGDRNRLRLVGAAAVAFLVLGGYNRFDRTTGGRAIENAVPGPVTLADHAQGGAEGPFFPSAAGTATGRPVEAEFFLDSAGCGRSGCHEDAVAQWTSSAHHFSSFNNQWYRKSIEYMQEVAGLDGPRWCAGCHDPALLLSGTMTRPVADFLDEPAAHAGLACVVCHSLKEVRSTAGNGAYVLEVPPMHALATHPNPVLRFLHDRILLMDPGPHRATFLKPFLVRDQAAFCSACHKVHLDVELNDYRWLRGFNTYDNWQASGVSGQGARSFYEPESPQQCTDCHMPPVPSSDPGADAGHIRDHRFLAANTALPVANRDSVQLAETIAFLQRGHLRVDVMAAVPFDEPAPGGQAGRAVPEVAPATMFAVGEEQGTPITGRRSGRARTVLGPLNDKDVLLRPGSTVRLDVVVRSLTIGHFFPTGTTDAQEAWLEVQVTDAAGRLLLHSGGMDGMTVDSTAHFYRSVMADGAARRIDKRNAFATRSTVYVNLIPPGGADVAHYVVAIPDDAVSPLSVSARVRYRKFTDAYTRFAFGGTFAEPFDPGEDHFSRDPREWTYDGVQPGVSSRLDGLPVVPVVTMAESSRTLHLGEPVPMPDRAEDLIRWNDYGIALLREGDLATALVAFERTTRLRPDYVDGWVNQARVHLVEGSLDRAGDALERAETLRPGFHKTAYFRGLRHKLLGEYRQARQAFEQVLASHPKDRVVWNDLGRALYLDGQLAGAVEAFEQVLRIDAEDVTAHYNLMLVHRALGDEARSRDHRIRYERFKADEREQALARAYRARHPADNNEAIAVHVHRQPTAVPTSPR